MSVPISKACCSVPAVQAEGYTAKGDFITFNGMKTYVTGGESKRAILFVYDVFGFASQTLQGADMLAQALDAQVLMPDFLDNGLPIDTMPVDTPEKQKLVQTFFSPGGLGYFPDGAKKVDAAARQVKKVYPKVEQLGGLGLCWGSKVLILASIDPDTPFAATASAHPARLDAEDAKKLHVPSLVLASDEEDADAVKAFDEVEKPKFSEVHKYPGMHHGWMGARSKLHEEANLKDFERGYAQVATWIKTVFDSTS